MFATMDKNNETKSCINFRSDPFWQDDSCKPEDGHSSNLNKMAS